MNDWRPADRFPDPALRVLDERFQKYVVVLAKVERLATGFRWAEGPVWFGDGRQLLWSDIPNDRIMRWDEQTGEATVFRQPANYANGNTRDRGGRLVTCEHGGRRVTRTEYDGSITVLAVVFVAISLVVFFLQKSRWGSGWRSVAFSERGTASAGSSVRIAKLTAFAASSSIAGIAGGLMAGQVSTAFPSGFTTLQSLALYVLSIVAGAHLVEMALFGGVLWVLIPELLKRWGIPQDWGLVVFGAMGIQALTSNSNLGQDIRNALMRRRQRKSGPATAVLVSLPEDTSEVPARATVGEVLLRVENLTVEFGQIKALRDVNMTLTEGTIVGLIGPNGAGKSTFVDAVSGFLPQHTGEVWLGEDRLNDLAPHQRARVGLRRTFQQDRVPPSLTVYEYMNFIARGKASREEIVDILDFFGCPGPGVRISNIDVGTRRIIEVAANIAARPRLLILDEPAAGLSHEEHLAFGQRLRQVPQRYQIAILIIEHDLDLVRSVCQYITVLDFGEVLASGEQDEVLSDPKVLKAYMGETELI